MLTPIRTFSPFGQPSGSAPIDVTPGIVAYYKLEESSGNRVDSSGNSLDLTPTNTPGNTTGKISNALAVAQASSQQVGRASYSALNLAADFTVAGWFNVTSYPQNTHFWSYSVSTRPGINFNTVGVGTFVVNGASIGIGTVAAGSGWRFIACRYRASDFFAEARLDGGAWTSGTGTSPTTTTGTFYLGARGDLARWMNGAIDEVGVWSRRLTDAEVNYLYNSGSGRTLF